MPVWQLLKEWPKPRTAQIFWKAKVPPEGLPPMTLMPQVAL